MTSGRKATHDWPTCGDADSSEDEGPGNEQHVAGVRSQVCQHRVSLMSVSA